jgi:hypothetical protein
MIKRDPRAQINQQHTKNNRGSKIPIPQDQEHINSTKSFFSTLPAVVSSFGAGDRCGERQVAVVVMVGVDTTSTME